MRISLTGRFGLIAVSLGLALSACSSTSPEQPNGSPILSVPSGASASSSVASSSFSGPSGTTNSADPLDNGGYAEYTWDDYVKAQRKMSELTSWPEVSRVRFISQEERSEVQATCLTDQGFPTTVESDGAFQTKITSEQEESLALATYICELQYPVDLRYSQALTRTQLRITYAYYRDSLIPCLEDQNLEIEQLPSEETYIEGMTTGTVPWSPYDSVDLASVDANALSKACPAMPAPDVLYAG